jgi:hypothetical protein
VTAVTNALAKAAEALQDYLRQEICLKCDPDFEEDCDYCRLDSLKYETTRLEDLARTVLEAADHPRLRATLDKALEACRRLLQADGLYARASEAVREGPDWSDEYSAAASSAWRQAVRLAREALEMAKECDRRGDA